MPDEGHITVEKGLSGHPRPELSVRHTFGSKMHADHREPLVYENNPSQWQLQ